ncbi:endonuclease SmrB [Shewanella sp. NIFS-20-20]|uniref:endonuclease SmrB n=1 Tax=Shewanella sp. NIFS-20-20 TaxID=2853806 RepID=UPI001C491E5E|nr:endonuclease SmrB [Shewanella sp. NIFS-20-20]MBV7315014.1 endonuclease SmrB [Shewanella sp. NIFS-20-20]
MTIQKNNLSSFAELMADIKPLRQDTRHFDTPVKAKTVLVSHKMTQDAAGLFSDTYQPLLPTDGPMRWRSPQTDSLELKRLRRGDYVPEILLDVHGMRQAEAKLELIALIEACIREHCHTCCVMHGYGQGILKQQIPLWLAQHPKVQAFHQAPKAWGGDAALLVLIDIGLEDTFD